MRKAKTNDKFQSELREHCKCIYTDDLYRGATNKMSFYCDFDHHWMATPANVLKYGSRCPFCAGQRAIVGKTDLWTTRPDVAKLLANPSDGYNCMEFSHKKLKFVCPNCGTVFEQDLNHVSKRGLSCPMCSDGISCPNKFMRNILLQLNIEFVPEFAPDWIKPKRYDFYFIHNGKQYIVEMDGGLGHGNEPPNGALWFDKSKSKSIDEYKDIKAQEHGIVVVRIDCNYGQDIVFKMMCQNIKQSMLGDIFDLNKVDFKLCELQSQKSLFYDICSMFNSGERSIKSISDSFKVSVAFVRRMLKIGRKNGIIVDLPENNNSGKFIAQDDPVMCVETGECFIGPNEVLKILGIKIYDVIDKDNRSAGKLPSGGKRHWKRLIGDDRELFIANYYLSR